MTFGSFQNQLYAGCTSSVPEPGMGCTVIHYSDRTACTVESIGRNKKGVVTEVHVREDRATRIDSNGMSECQSYSYSPDPEGRVYIFTLRRNGRWAQLGSPAKGGIGILFGGRRHYHDYSF